MAILTAPCNGVLVVLLVQSIPTATSKNGAREWSPRIVTKKDTSAFAKNWTQTTGAKVQVAGESEATTLSSTITGTGIVAQISSRTNIAAAVADWSGEPSIFNSAALASEQNELLGRGRRGGRGGRRGGGDVPDWVAYIAGAVVGIFVFWLILILPCKIYNFHQKRKEDLQRWKSEMIEFVRCGSADSPGVAVPMLGAWRAVNSMVKTSGLQDDRPDLTYEYHVFQFHPDGMVRGRGCLFADDQQFAFNLGGKYNAVSREVVWCETFANTNVFGGEKLVKGTYEESQMQGTWLLADGYEGTFVMQQVGVFQEPPSAAAIESSMQLSGAIEKSNGNEAIEMTVPYQPTPGDPVVQAKLTVMPN